MRQKFIISLGVMTFQKQEMNRLSMQLKEWIFIIDADEYIDDDNKEKIKELLKNPYYDAYSIYTKNIVSDTIPIFIVNSLVRLYKNLKAYFHISYRLLIIARKGTRKTHS